MKYGIGIDIGGTKISMVIGNEKGHILARKVIPTLKYKRKQESLQNLIHGITELTDQSKIPVKKIAGIGVGLPGAVNPSSGLVPISPNLQGWKGVPLKRILERKFGAPVRMTNDGNAAIMGEKFFGQARGKKDAIYVTVSTGVGGGILVNDRLVEGADYVGGEIGHMVIIAQGNRCNCGQKGCLEAYASGTAIARRFREQMRKRKKLNKKVLWTTREIGEAARKGNKLAIDTYLRAGYLLGVGIGTLLNVLNPEVVIFGGGVFKSAPPFFWKTMIRSVRENSWPQAFRSTKIVRTKLGDNVGNLGALALAFMQCRL